MSFDNIKKIWTLSDLGMLDHLSSIEFDVLIGAMSFADNKTGKGICASDHKIAKRIRKGRSTVTKAMKKLIDKEFLLCRSPGCRSMLDININMLDDCLKEHLPKESPEIIAPEKTKLAEIDCSIRTNIVPTEHISNSYQTCNVKLKQKLDVNIKENVNVPLDLSEEEAANSTLVYLLRKNGCYDGLIISLMANYSHGAIYNEATGLIDRIGSNKGKRVVNFGGLLRSILAIKHTMQNNNVFKPHEKLKDETLSTKPSHHKENKTSVHQEHLTQKRCESGQPSSVGDILNGMIDSGFLKDIAPRSC